MQGKKLMSMVEKEKKEARDKITQVDLTIDQVCVWS